MKHDNNMNTFGGWLITIIKQSSKLFSLWQSQHAVFVTVRKVVKLQLNYCNALVIKWMSNIVPFGGKNMMFISSLLIDGALSFLTLGLRRQASMTQAEKFLDPFLLKSDVNLFNHLVRKRMLRVVVLRVLFFADMRLPRIQCRRFALFEAGVMLMQIN